MEQGNIVRIIRKKYQDGKEEDERALINRSILNVMTLLDKYNEVVLDARGRNILYACNIALSRNLEKLMNIYQQNTKLETVNWEKGIGNHKKKIIRMSSIKIVLKRN